MDDLKVTITTEEYKELIEDSIILAKVKRAFQSFDRYDLKEIMENLLEVDSYETIKQRKEELRIKLAQAKVEKEINE